AESERLLREDPSYWASVLAIATIHGVSPEAFTEAPDAYRGLTPSDVRDGLRRWLEARDRMGFIALSQPAEEKEPGLVPRRQVEIERIVALAARREPAAGLLAQERPGLHPQGIDLPGQMDEPGVRAHCEQGVGGDRLTDAERQAAAPEQARQTR